MFEQRMSKEEFFMRLIKGGLIEINFDTGEIISYLSGKKQIIHYKHPQGYIQLAANGYRMLAHRLIWITANGNIPNDKEINHKNGIKNDNRLCNLEVVTRSQNVLHARHILKKSFGIFDRNNKGENNGRSLVTREQVKLIRELHDAGNRTQQSLAEEFGLKKSQIHNIVRRKQWMDD